MSTLKISPRPLIVCTGTAFGGYYGRMESPPPPPHLVEIMKSFYDNFTCCVGDGDILFEVHTGVRQGCVMSTFLFNLVVDWIMHRTTEDQVRGIRWTPFSHYLEDLDNADDIALLSHTHTHIQEKTQHLCKASWPEHQQQEDGNYGTERYQHTTSPD